MSFIRQASSGHYEDLVAQRARVLAICPPSHRRRILGQAPRYRPVKTHEITVDLRTGDRQIVSDPVAAPRVFIVVQPPPNPPAPPTPPRNMAAPIVDAVAAAFGVTVYNLHSPSRQKPHCLARFACFWLLTSRLKLSSPKIGRILGRRDHTTVLSGLRRARDLYEHDADWRAKYDAAVAALEEGGRK